MLPLESPAILVPGSSRSQISFPPIGATLPPTNFTCDDDYEGSVLAKARWFLCRCKEYRVTLENPHIPMAYDTVLRIKRKRTDESLTMLLTSDAAEPEGKKRRVWQLSRSSDSRGIPVPTARLAKQVEEQPSVVELREPPSPPRFSVRKRKASETIMSNRSQRVLDLERESKTLPAPEILSLSDNEVLNSMLSDYLSNNDITQSSNSSSEEDYVYDIYYPQATTQAIEDATLALRTNYGLLEHFDWDDTANLVVEDDSTDSDGDVSEDSNAEDWIGNEYPDEEDSASNNSGDSFEILGSDNEHDETFDRSEWD